MRCRAWMSIRPWKSCSCNPKTEAFLLPSSAVPIESTNYDWKVKEGIVKVIYLPDPQFQDVAGTGNDEIISTTEPGADPIQEALRRGSILAASVHGQRRSRSPGTHRH